MSQYGYSTRDRVKFFTSSLALADAPQTGTEGSYSFAAPHIVLSPKCAGGRPTVGFGFVLAPAEYSAAAFTTLTITPWKLMRNLQRWVKLSALTVNAFYQYIICYEVLGGDALYFQMATFTTQGQMTMAFEERF